MVMKEAQEMQRRLCMSCIRTALWRRCREFAARNVGVWAVKVRSPWTKSIQASGVERLNGVMHPWQARPYSVIPSTINYVFNVHMSLIRLERSIATRLSGSYTPPEDVD